jgi:hypothetical protein
MRHRLYQFAKKIAQRAGFVLLLGGLVGCQSITSTANGPLVRIIDTSPDAPGLDIYQNGSAMAYNLGFGTVTSYVSIPAGVSTITADTAGTKQVLTTSSATYIDGAEYTILIGNVAANLQEMVLTDQPLPAPLGEISLRVLQEATRMSGGVDLYLVPSGATLATASPVLKNLVFGSNSGYITVPAGTYTIELLPTGTPTTTAATATTPASTATPIYTGPATAYTNGAVRTVLLLDNQVLADPGFQVVVAHDFDPASATS